MHYAKLQMCEQCSLSMLKGTTRIAAKFVSISIHFARNDIAKTFEIKNEHTWQYSTHLFLLRYLPNLGRGFCQSGNGTCTRARRLIEFKFFIESFLKQSVFHEQRSVACVPTRN